MPYVRSPLRFGRFELQPEERRLLADGTPVEIAARAFDVLRVLVERAGHLVSKDELMERVWSGVIVEDNTLQGQISILRKILGPSSIATVSGRGYRFDLAVEAPTEATPGPPAHNLPRQLTSFIGRVADRAELQAIMRRSRMITLTGAGGCGKTRLAIEVAGDSLPRYPDGVWLVELAPLTDPALVRQSVAQALKLAEQPGRDSVEVIVDHLKGKCALILLDNAEHLRVACAQIAEAMLQASAHVSVLATSREPLGIPGEHTFRVPSLSLPSSEAATPEEIRASESAQLFIDRARQQRPGFELTPDNAQAIVAICRQLDGIPLALELAAPRVRSMSVEEVARRLARAFKLLTAGSPTALPRQRTLRSLIDWSYDLLSEQEQAMLCRMSVFSGGFFPEAAEHVCSGDDVHEEDVLEMLSSLCDKSLVVAEERDGVTRYHLLETVRQYGRERLAQQGEEARWRDRHFAWVLAFATEVAPLLNGPDQKVWLARLDSEHDNLRAALGWAARHGGDPMAGLALGNAISTFWWTRQHLTESCMWLGALLASTRGTLPSVARGRALTTHGLMLWQLGDLAASRSLHEEAVEMGRALGDKSLTASALGNLMFVISAEGNPAAARAVQEEILAMRREAGDPRTIAVALNNLGVICLNLGDLAAARPLLEEGLSICRALGDRGSISNDLLNLSIVANAQGDHEAAIAFATEALATSREIGDPRGEAMALNVLGTVTCLQGDLVTGEAYLRQCLAGHRDLGARTEMAEGCDSLAIGCRIARPLRAARIWGGIERVREELGYQTLPLNALRYEGYVADARAALADDAAFDSAWREGRKLSLDEVVAYALSEA